MRLHIKDGFGRRHSDLLALIILGTTVSVVGSGILYLGESVHVPAQTRIFTGPGFHDIAFNLGDDAALIAVMCAA